MLPATVPAVWIVDDDEDDQFLFEATFKQLNPPVSVKLLNDGEELLPALEQSAALPQLIILDLNMPRLNGFDTLKQLRAVSEYKSLPVIVLTTSGEERDQAKVYKLGASGFLTKPPSMDRLLALFSQLAQDWLKLTL